MSANPKPRSDATLKTLPETRQDAIAEYARAHSLAETVTWLRADGLQTSPAALSRWLSWYSLREQLQKNESTVNSLLEKLRSKHPEWTPEQIQEAGQMFFTELAIEQQDVHVWRFGQQIRIKDAQLKLDQQKFRRETCELFLKWYQDEEAKRIASSNTPNAEKVEKLGQRIFGELWT